ncbi:hypothetical protein [Streptacidiphilus sp. P02-A3a]|uniref:hypothetical protein n=1 Tax=Streptacidiphilus sp. P02-A3a TaxID=2704468 RepID=UPI0015F79F7F|nr:hypothetical protein [Streptacidiphilus sp. P02-A3a]QMU70786.1 hypothetical protein GXP74_23805 [Streptacidiphilus sp. P02-A3a]
MLNFGGTGLTGPVRWHDLQLRRDYPGTGALGHGGALCDPLGVRFAGMYADRPVRLTAVREGRRVPTDTAGFAPADAARLHAITEKLLADLPG